MESLEDSFGLLVLRKSSVDMICIELLFFSNKLKLCKIEFM
ncbi:hypothetical protein PPIS_a0337 [Pseudoalteromonas piscicida]|uniref:Uncharacterized protein n=1 Tax=Pseudoalteromonas piscicida TaxID=43662 RepID=A0ABM6NA45_PSEO7|nr:hypothetical protein PPIS_a0337 [Pseudoalteromonas piscicida]